MARSIIHVPTLQNLERTRGNLGLAYPFVALGIPPLDMIVWDDDFLGDTIRGDATAPGIYEVVTGVDGAINILADQAGGVAEIRASDGAGAANEYCGVSLPELAFQGDNYCAIAARFYLDAITTVKVEVGFTDVTTDAGAVNAKATPTFTATNFCGWVLDTNDNEYWEGMGVKAGTGATTLEAAISPTASTYEWLIVVIEGDNAYFYRLDQYGKQTYPTPGATAMITDAIEGGTQVCPWIFVQVRAGADRNIGLDRIVAWGNRTSTS